MSTYYISTSQEEGTEGGFSPCYPVFFRLAWGALNFYPKCLKNSELKFWISVYLKLSIWTIHVLSENELPNAAQWLILDTITNKRDFLGFSSMSHDLTNHVVTVWMFCNGKDNFDWLLITFTNEWPTFLIYSIRFRFVSLSQTWKLFLQGISEFILGLLLRKLFVSVVEKIFLPFG